MDKIELLQKIEQERNSKVIAYIVADMANSPFQGKMAPDVVPFFYEHLRNIGRVPRLDVYLYSSGGDTIVPWRLVTLARERCDHLSVIIPHKAHSAATLFALGANEIVMGELGELSPIDPSITTPFNPTVQQQQQTIMQQISVEDVSGFFNFARERLQISSEDNMTKALELLTQKLHPLALGGVYRSHALIRMIATNMLSLHMKTPRERNLINQIVDNLAEKLYHHNYYIGRKEAEQLGLQVIYPNGRLEELIWNLFDTYRSEMGLGSVFDPVQHVEEQASSIEQPVAVLESVGLRSAYTKKVTLRTMSKNPPQLAIEEVVVPWKTQRFGGSHEQS